MRLDAKYEKNFRLCAPNPQTLNVTKLYLRLTLKCMGRRLRYLICDILRDITELTAYLGKVLH